MKDFKDFQKFIEQDDIKNEITQATCNPKFNGSFYPHFSPVLILLEFYHRWVNQEQDARSYNL